MQRALRSHLTAAFMISATELGGGKAFKGDGFTVKRWLLAYTG